MRNSLANNTTVEADCKFAASVLCCLSRDRHENAAHDVIASSGSNRRSAPVLMTCPVLFLFWRIE